MTQSIIAADLDAYENVMWFTSSYLIVMASLAPLVGRLAMIFSPGNLVLGSAIFFAAGAIASSQARTFGFFIFGRVLTGVGGGGVITLSMILILQLTSKKRRGVFIGLTNAVRPGTSRVLTIQLLTGNRLGIHHWTFNWRCCLWCASFGHRMGMSQLPTADAPLIGANISGRGHCFGCKRPLESSLVSGSILAFQTYLLTGLQRIRPYCRSLPPLTTPVPLPW